eukprot:Gb_31996 [translate_table: standard]
MESPYLSPLNPVQEATEGAQGWNLSDLSVVQVLYTNNATAASAVPMVADNFKRTLIKGHISQNSLSDQNAFELLSQFLGLEDTLFETNAKRAPSQMENNMQSDGVKRLKSNGKNPTPKVGYYLSDQGRQKRFRSEHKTLGRGKSTYTGVTKNGKKWQSRSSVNVSTLIKAVFLEEIYE